MQKWEYTETYSFDTVKTLGLQGWTLTHITYHAGGPAMAQMLSATQYVLKRPTGIMPAGTPNFIKDKKV